MPIKRKKANPETDPALRDRLVFAREDERRLVLEELRASFGDLLRGRIALNERNAAQHEKNGLSVFAVESKGRAGAYRLALEEFYAAMVRLYESPR